MKRITISEIEDPKARIEAVLFNLQKPMRISEISRSASMSRNLVDYHLRTMIDKEIVYCNPEEKTYRLADIYYDDTLAEGLEELFTPVAESIIGASADIKTPHGVVENLKCLMGLFCGGYD